MDGLDSRYFDQVSLVSLSTTLETNACIEGKGGRAKLFFLGVEKRVLDWVGKDYGLHPDSGEIYCCEYKSRYDGEITSPTGASCSLIQKIGCTMRTVSASSSSMP